MITVDLTKTRVPFSAYEWLIKTYGPAGDRWTMKDLTFLQFRKDRDATLFLLHWASEADGETV